LGIPVFPPHYIYLTLFWRVGFKRLATTYLAVLGGLWLVLDFCTFFLPVLEELRGVNGFLAFLLISGVITIYLNRPGLSIKRELSAQDVTVEVVIGDIFNQDGHLVVGTNDVFDTELGDIIKRESVQGQFLERVYGGDKARLDRDIEAVLKTLQLNAKEDVQKKLGKRMRYPIGTIAALGNRNKKYFMVAFAEMDKDCVASSDGFNLWHSLNCLWGEVRAKGQGEKIVVPILGSGLSRTNLNRRLLAKIIIMSFVVASRKQYVTKGLILVISPQDLDQVNVYNLEDFVTTVCA
jgi:Thoeris protein ThsA, Macro domain